MKINKLDFSNQTIYVGIDVHKKSWTITIRFQGMQLKTYTMDPNPTGLIKYLHRNYPKANYESVYEAGFCGYWIDRKLCAGGIKNIIVSPADVPTKNNEKRRKTDKIDSKKLARELNSGTLDGIYVPSEEDESLRVLNRLRMQLTKDQTRLKNRIKSLLDFIGIKIPENHELQHWSRKFIDHLSQLEMKHKTTKIALEKLIGNLKQVRTELCDIIKNQRAVAREQNNIQRTIEHLQSIPGIGFITAITLYTEIIDIMRFSKIDKLCSYVGLIPAVASSGEKERTLGLSNQQNKFLRNMLIESSWVAVRKDPAMTMAFGNLTKRMSKQEAIIRIAKKMLSRIKYVWQHQTDYVYAVVE